MKYLLRAYARVLYCAIRFTNARNNILLLMAVISTSNAMAEPPFNLYVSTLPYPVTYQKISSRTAACPAWMAYEDPLGRFFSNPRPGKWSSTVQFPGAAVQFTCYYTSPFSQDDQRSVGQGVCGVGPSATGTFA